LTLLGYIAAIFIGILLGLLGGGGSILSVPVLRYMFNYPADVATGYSLFVVGISGIVGVAFYAKDKLIHTKSLLTFGVIASVVSFLNRKYFVASLPQELFTIGSVTITKDLFIMLVFAIMMVLAARHMILDKKTSEQTQEASPLTYVLAGIFVGLFTSLVGAGGGFIVVPALVAMYKMPIKMAIGTSISIVVINSLAGFAGDITAGAKMEWPFLLVFTGLACAGIFVGIYASKKIDSKKLKPLFGWFIIATSIYVVTKELLELS
jgi:uncharacterized membrane protein YfcA